MSSASKCLVRDFGASTDNEEKMLLPPTAPIPTEKIAPVPQIKHLERKAHHIVAAHHPPPAAAQPINVAPPTTISPEKEAALEEIEALQVRRFKVKDEQRKSERNSIDSTGRQTESTC